MQIIINTDKIDQQVDIVQDELRQVDMILRILEKKRRTGSIGLETSCTMIIDESINEFQRLKKEFKKKEENLKKIKFDFKNWKSDMEMKYNVIRKLTDL